MAKTAAIASLQWGDAVVAVHTVRPGEVLGSAALPDELRRGDDPTPLVRVAAEGKAVVFVPAGACARVSGDGHGPGWLRVVGPRAVAVPRGERAIVTLGTVGDRDVVIDLEVQVVAIDADA